MEIDKHKLILHPERVAQWLREGDCPPLYVEFGLTNRCNHRCNFCALDWVEEGGNFDIDSSLMVRTIEDMSAFGVKSVMFAGEGEPLLHEDIGIFCRTAKENGIDVSITTNGSKLDEAKREGCLPYLSWIRFSIDAGNAKTYAKIHGVDIYEFGKVLKNIEESVRFKQKQGLEVTIGTQVVTTPETRLEEILALGQRLKEIGADNLQIKPYSHHPKSSVAFEVYGKERANAKIVRDIEDLDSPEFKIFYRKETARRVEEGATYPTCWGLSFISLVDARGNILPCNLFYDEEAYWYGNLHEQSFSNIWTGEKRKEVLEKIRKDGVKKCRSACRCDPINRYLNRLVKPEEHDNFI